MSGLWKWSSGVGTHIMMTSHSLIREKSVVAFDLLFVIVAALALALALVLVDDDDDVEDAGGGGSGGGCGGSRWLTESIQWN